MSLAHVGQVSKGKGSKSTYRVTW